MLFSVDATGRTLGGVKVKVASMPLPLAVPVPHVP
jgi:hypothetical protein